MRTIIARERGRLNEVLVVEEQGQRGLHLGAEIEGRCFLEPCASELFPGCPPGPGPIPVSLHWLGWLAAAAGRPRGRLLMLGLGAGAATVALLHSLPELTIEVVEIDPVVVRLARAHFPLVRHLEAEGRLVVHLADAARMVASCSRRFDAALVDVYAGDETLALQDEGFLRDLLRLAPALWFNYIGVINDGPMQRFLALLARVGCVPRAVVSPQRVDALSFLDLSLAQNWIIANELPSPRVLRGVSPLEGLPGPQDVLERVRASYGNLVEQIRRQETLARLPAQPAS